MADVMTEKGRAWRWRALLPILWFPLILFFDELVVKATAFGRLFDRGTLYTLLFSIALGLVFSFLSSLWERRGNRVCSLVLLGLATAWFAVQTVYVTVCKTFMTVYSLGGAGKALQFWRSILIGIGECWLPLLLVIAPFVLWCVFGGKWIPARRGKRRVLVGIAAAAAVVQLVGALAATGSVGGVMSPSYLYRESFVPERSVATFGVMTTLRLDIKTLLFGTAEEAPVPTPTPTPTPSPVPTPVVTPTPGAEATPTPAPIVYGENVMPIDFAGLAAATQDETLKSMHAYFSAVTPTKKNQYTGKFKGKNLILITAEGFSRFAVDPVLTPTLYKLSHTGFIFENFYNPLWWVSTLDGEYAVNTSLIPKPGVWSLYQSGQNDMYFTMGNQLQRQNYATRAYHNHTWDYYSRDVSHPNLGYDYKGLGHGLDVAPTWPESDLEMMEKSMPEYVGDAPFHTYYMTVSGHMNYNFEGNAMSAKHQAEVAQVPMSEGPRAYLACQMELDQAMKYLLDELERAGELENTVICLSPDHYPYGMEQSELDEMAGGPLDMRFDVYHSTLILWSGDMKTPVTVEKYCSSLDILPTLSNLFGLEYDSRLLMGTDILSDSPGLVILSDRSFITEYGRYDAVDDQFLPNQGVEVPAEYVVGTWRQVSDKFKFSKLVLETDYYRALGLSKSP